MNWWLPLSIHSTGFLFLLGYQPLAYVFCKMVGKILGPSSIINCLKITKLAWYFQDPSKTLHSVEYEYDLFLIYCLYIVCYSWQQQCWHCLTRPWSQNLNLPKICSSWSRCIEAPRSTELYCQVCYHRNIYWKLQISYHQKLNVLTVLKCWKISKDQYSPNANVKYRQVKKSLVWSVTFNHILKWLYWYLETLLIPWNKSLSYANLICITAIYFP